MSDGLRDTGRFVCCTSRVQDGHDDQGEPQLEKRASLFTHSGLRFFFVE